MGVRSSVACVVAVLLGVTMGVTPAASSATTDLDDDRSWAVSLVSSGTPSVRRAAEAALLGSDADLRAFVESGFADAHDADYRLAAQVLGSTDGPALRAAAAKALKGSDEALRTFVDGGFRRAWEADEELRVVRVLDSGGLHTRNAAEEALNGDPGDWSTFLATELERARYADDEQAAGRMLEGGPDNSGPALSEAADLALKGTPEELHEFLTRGQHVARARDVEMATVAGLTEQARAAGEATATHAADATSASARAVAAAERARAAAEEALAETKAAGTAADGASAAAGRAADAAVAAQNAAGEASAASSAALRAAQTAADGARRATAAASLTARAAAAAQTAAAGARTDAGKAQAARDAAQAARDAAAQAAVLDEVRAQRDAALAQARAAAGAAARASVNADAAAVAADQASRQAGVSAEQAKRTRDAAAAAKTQAAVAAQAAARSLAFAEDAAAASDEAFTFAARAAEHATAAAAAADEAAAQAGVAGTAAAEAAAHAADATAASELAVAAADQAGQVADLARRADAARLDEATDQGIAEAREARAAEQAAGGSGEQVGWDRGVRWDTEEEDRIPAATRALLDEAGAQGASGAVVLDKGRQAALALMTTGGEWTRAAATEALAGDEVTLRSWLDEGRVLAAGQDNRARVWHLVDTLPEGPERTAARASLDGDDAAVAQFLRTRAYPGKAAADERALAQILASDPGARLYGATQEALNGTAQDAHEFLRDGQHVARALDQEVEIGRVMRDGGPEVKAAAQVALEGPASYGSYFLAVGQYEAAQRDLEQAAHVQAVNSLVDQARQYARTAVADAAEARRVAAVAQGAAADATAYANQARAAADEAAAYQAAAAQSAAAAKVSADQAAASAATARTAAAQAQTAAKDAARSAVTATAASQRARSDAAAAQAAKAEARASAASAGLDAREANQAALEASATYRNRLKEQEVAVRNTAPGTGPDGITSADYIHEYKNCLNPFSSERTAPKCAKAYGELIEMVLNPGRCSAPTTRDSLGCRMVETLAEDYAYLAEHEPELLDSMAADAFQLLLGACGLVPGIGEPCDGLDMVISGFRGDWWGAGFSLAAMIPFGGWGLGGVKVSARAIRLIRAFDAAEGALQARRTIWDDVRATDSPIPGSQGLPRSFELTAGNVRVWVHPNVTDHIGRERVVNYQRRGLSPEAIALNVQQQVRSLQAAVAEATADGIPLNKPMVVGGWELEFSQRDTDLLPVLIHGQLLE
ncbi:ALF repeat-containing protein [Cellulomonas sp. NPDC057328]|uniref:ALF repeat-containing protein n=1 Tax=Cellulomonas sp. NPDC057328 TaxID=3346101 RepID=UPI003634D438